jgi:ubiquitin-like protein Pup
MAESKQSQRPRSEGDSGASAKGGSKKISKKGKDLKEDMDSLVDEIDAVLEENAEEFVKNYVQRGGE